MLPTKFRLSFIILIVVASVISCTTEEMNQLDENDILQLEVDLQKLETAIVKDLNILKQNNSLLQNKGTISEEGVEFLAFLEEVKGLAKSSENVEEVRQFISDKNNSIKSLKSFEKVNVEIGDLILSSFNKFREEGDYNSLKLISARYKEFVEERLQGDEETKEIIENIISIKQWIAFKYVFVDQKNNKSPNSITDKEWICAWRDCWDCCMYRTYKEYNPVDMLQFFISPGADVAWNGASCAYDCFIDDEEENDVNQAD